MAAYEKPPKADFLGFDSSGALHDPSGFGAYAQPPYASNFVLPTALTNASPENEHLHYVTGPPARSQQSFRQAPSSLRDPRIGQAPDVTSWTPQEGPEGTSVSVYFQSPFDLLAPPELKTSLSFASKNVNCEIDPLSAPSEPLKRYVISAAVPAFITTGWHSFSVPLRLTMESSNTPSNLQVVDVGAFKYHVQVPQSNQQRKRKASISSVEISQPRPKKLSTSLRLQDHGGEASQQNASSPYSPFLPTPTNGMYPSHKRKTASPRPLGHQYSTSVASQASLTAPSPHTPAWSPAFAPVNQTSPAPPITPIPRQSALSSPLKSANPTLMRTSTIQQNSGAVANGGSGAMPGQSFNPYAIYPLKAVLKLKGSLDSMAENWTPEEFEARRRLVQFTRSQSGSTILAKFAAIAPEDRSPNSITISCIWWAERQECFVTSVDTIFLLESLVAVRFTVEEKNRIRRNLEGFRPLTVSKSKSDSEEFFKVIMGFPNPKPRNIEKDVKVFPWKILAHALKKIISKYSASYASTASAMPTPASSTYASTESSAEYHSSGSPPIMEVMSTPAPSYPTTTPASYSPHIIPGRMSAPVTAVGTPDLRLQLPTMHQAYSLPTNFSFHGLPEASMPQPPNDQTPQIMSAPVHRMSQPWDFSNFVNTTPTTVIPGQLHGMPYVRPAGPLEMSAYIPPVSYAMAAPTSQN